MGTVILYLALPGAFLMGRIIRQMGQITFALISSGLKSQIPPHIVSKLDSNVKLALKSYTFESVNVELMDRGGRLHIYWL